jgi:hypothetical protein
MKDPISKIVAGSDGDSPVNRTTPTFKRNRPKDVLPRDGSRETLAQIGMGFGDLGFRESCVEFIVIIFVFQFPDYSLSLSGKSRTASLAVPVQRISKDPSHTANANAAMQSSSSASSLPSKSSPLSQSGSSSTDSLTPSSPPRMLSNKTSFTDDDEYGRRAPNSNNSATISDAIEYGDGGADGLYSSSTSHERNLYEYNCNNDNSSNNNNSNNDAEQAQGGEIPAFEGPLPNRLPFKSRENRSVTTESLPDNRFSRDRTNSNNNTRERTNSPSVTRTRVGLTSSHGSLDHVIQQREKDPNSAPSQGSSLTKSSGNVMISRSVLSDSGGNVRAVASNASDGSNKSTRSDYVSSSNESHSNVACDELPTASDGAPHRDAYAGGQMSPTSLRGELRENRGVDLQQLTPLGQHQQQQQHGGMQYQNPSYFNSPSGPDNTPPRQPVTRSNTTTAIKQPVRGQAQYASPGHPYRSESSSAVSASPQPQFHATPYNANISTSLTPSRAHSFQNIYNSHVNNPSNPYMQPLNASSSSGSVNEAATTTSSTSLSHSDGVGLGHPNASSSAGVEFTMVPNPPTRDSSLSRETANGSPLLRKKPQGRSSVIGSVCFIYLFLFSHSFFSSFFLLRFSCFSLADQVIVSPRRVRREHTDNPHTFKDIAQLEQQSPSSQITHANSQPLPINRHSSPTANTLSHVLVPKEREPLRSQPSPVTQVAFTMPLLPPVPQPLHAQRVANNVNYSKSNMNNSNGGNSNSPPQNNHNV